METNTHTLTDKATQRVSALQRNTWPEQNTAAVLTGTLAIHAAAAAGDGSPQCTGPGWTCWWEEARWE